MDVEKEKKVGKDESGWSEKESDLDIEVRAGEWQNLNKFKTYQNRSRQGKIILTYQAVSNRLNQLVMLYYRLVRDNSEGGKKMLIELRRLRVMQEILLNCLIWEPKGTLDKDLVPEEIWELIK